MLTQRLGQNLEGNPEYVLLEIIKREAIFIDTGDSLELSSRLAEQIYKNARSTRSIQGFKGIRTINKRLTIEDQAGNRYVAIPVPKKELKTFNCELAKALEGLMLTE